MAAFSSIALGVLAVGTVASVSEQRKAGKAAEQQYRAEERKSEIQNIRSVRQQIREARMVQASMTNVAAQTGGMGGSGLAGGTSSVGAQLAGNLGYMSQIAEQNTAITSAAIAGVRASTNATIFSTIGSLAGTYGSIKTPTKAVE
jgi:hypothetical protein